MTQNGPGTAVFDDEVMIQSEQLNIPNLHCSCLAFRVTGKAVNLGSFVGDVVGSGRGFMTNRNGWGPQFLHSNMPNNDGFQVRNLQTSTKGPF